MAESDALSTPSHPIAAPPMNRRGSLTRPLALALAAMIGLALYLAWPDLMGLREAPAPNTATIVGSTETPVPAVPPSAAPAPLSTSAAPASSEVELAALRARLEAVEQATALRKLPSGPADVAIAEQLTEFATRLEAIERRPPGTGDTESVARDAELGAHLAAIEKRLAAAETTSAELAALTKVIVEMHTEVGTLAQRLTSVEQRGAEDARLIALATAKAALSAAAHAGTALAHEVSDLRALLLDPAPLAAPLKEIGRFTEHGALNYEALRARFPALAREVVRASAKPDADAGWVDQTIARLGSIVTIRKTSGDLAPGSMDERLVRAERALAESNGVAALEALDTLKGGEALESFQSELKRRAALDDAVRAIDLHVTGLIAARIIPPPAKTTQ